MIRRFADCSERSSVTTLDALFRDGRASRIVDDPFAIWASVQNPRDHETTPVNPESTQPRLLRPTVFETIESASRSASPEERIAVLTLFEYLRQRSHQSILSGAHQALEELEGKAPDNDGDAAAKMFDRFRIGPIAPSAEPQSAPGPSSAATPGAPQAAGSIRLKTKRGWIASDVSIGPSAGLIRFRPPTRPIGRSRGRNRRRS